MKRKMLNTACVAALHGTALKHSAHFAAVDQICRTAEASGWPGQDAFLAAMVMHAHGITPAGARELFPQLRKVDSVKHAHISGYLRELGARCFEVSRRPELVGTFIPILQLALPTLMALLQCHRPRLRSSWLRQIANGG